jgi:hypothetical protein
LGFASTAKEATIPGTQQHARTLSDDSDLSSSSANDQDEWISENNAQNLLQQILALHSDGVISDKPQWVMEL